MVWSFKLIFSTLGSIVAWLITRLDKGMRTGFCETLAGATEPGIFPRTDAPLGGI